MGRLSAAFLLLMVSAGVACAQVEQRVALVIGNGKYRTAEWVLRNPANDAMKMAAMLRRAGFDVIEQEDVTRRMMITSVREFADRLSPGGVGLFYYAGHGIQSQGINFLVPTDATLTVADDLKYEAFDVQDVLDRLSDARVRVSLVILDACRDNPFAKSSRSSARGLTPLDPPRGTIIAYATSPGHVAGDGSGEDSVYTSELLRAMSEPGRKLLDMFARVTDAVARQTANAQTPWINSTFRGDFYFFPPATVNDTPQSAAPDISIEAQEQAAWTAVAGSATQAPFEAFVKRFPAGAFADIARAKIEELTAAKQPVPAPAPLPGSDAYAFVNRGIAYMKQDDPDRAIQAFNEAIKRDPKIAAAFVNRGTAYLSKSEPDRAIQDYNEAIKLDPADAAAFYNRGTAYGDKAHPDRAIQDYNQAIRLDPKNAMAFYNRGNAYRNEGQLDRAIPDYEEAIRLDPTYANAFYNRGVAYRALGRTAQAAADFDKAKQLQPNLPEPSQQPN